MEPEQMVDAPETPTKSFWHSVTPFSKYAAMLLFIAMPFVGGYVGYHYAPEKVVEVQIAPELDMDSETVEENRVAQNKWLVPGQVVQFDIKNDRYVVSEDELVEQGYLNPEQKGNAGYFDYYAERVTKIDDTYVLLAISTNPAGYTSTYLVNEIDGVIVREIRNGKYMGVSDWFVIEDSDLRTSYQLLLLENEVLLVDHVNNEEVVIYREENPSISLLEVCELGGCVGYIEHTVTGDVRVSRFTKRNSSNESGHYWREYIDTIEIKLPDKYKQPWLRVQSETERQTYENEEYGFAFEYPVEFGKLELKQFASGENANKSIFTITSENSGEIIVSLYGKDYYSGTDTIKSPICNNERFKKYHSECIKTENSVGSEYDELTLQMSYGWEKRYEFEVTDELSLIIFQQGDDDGSFPELREIQKMIVDTFKRI